MATNQTHASADRETHPLLNQLREMHAAAAQGFFTYSVKIVCGRQTGGNCCCVAGTRPGLYATEVNIQNFNFVEATVLKFVQPLIHGAVLAREPDVTNPAALKASSRKSYFPRWRQRWTIVAASRRCCQPRAERPRSVSSQLLRRVGAVQVRPLGARQNAELHDAP